MSFKNSVEDKIRKFSYSTKPIINGSVDEDTDEYYILFVEGEEIRVIDRGDCIEWEMEESCEYCGGTGEVAVMETVWPGEPHQASTGTEECICQIGR